MQVQGSRARLVGGWPKTSFHRSLGVMWGRPLKEGGGLNTGQVLLEKNEGANNPNWGSSKEDLFGFGGVVVILLLFSSSFFF